MVTHYILWAVGKDRPGIVASVTEILFKMGANVEDSSMMRLGSEFGILLIFSKSLPANEAGLVEKFQPLSKMLGLKIGVKKISENLARFKPMKSNAAQVSVFGSDHPGIVYKLTSELASQGFNITDLSTHRTTGGKTPGFILILEGELGSPKTFANLENHLKTLQKKWRLKISLNRLNSPSL